MDGRVVASRTVLVEDFVRRIHEHFAPRKVEVEFYEGGDGIDFITVENGDGTFALYRYDTNPSAVDVVDQVFRATDGLPVTGVEVVGPPLLREKAMKATLRDVKRIHGIGDGVSLGEWCDAAGENGERFRDEWDAWLEGKRPVVFKYEKEEPESGSVVTETP
jgi:hypothetical protein